MLTFTTAVPNYLYRNPNRGSVLINSKRLTKRSGKPSHLGPLGHADEGDIDILVLGS